MSLSRKSSGQSLASPSTNAKDSPGVIEPQYQDFKSFLDQSPYAKNHKSHHRNRLSSDDPFSDKAFNKELDQLFDYFEIRKEREPRNYLNQIAETPGSVEEILPSKTDEALMGAHNGSTQASPGIESPNDIHGMVDHSARMGLMAQMSTGGSPRSHVRTGESVSFDKSAKKLMEGLQTKLIKLEQENRKLKREVNDLTNQNKKYQNQVASFITEQENFAKTRETYEKRVKRLQDYCKNSDETMTALKRILSLQESELVERLAKKEVSSPSQAQKSVTTDRFSPKKVGSKATLSEDGFFPAPNLEKQKSGFGPITPSMYSSKANSINDNNARPPSSRPQTGRSSQMPVIQKGKV